MARILFTAILFFMTFSHHLMAAEAQLKKAAATLLIEDTPACIAAHDKCLKMKDGKDLNACVTACQEAEDKCNPTKNPSIKVKNKTDLTHTRYGIARSYRKTCAQKIEKLTK